MERCQPEDFARRFEVQLKQNDKTDKATSAQSTLAGVRLPTELRDDEAWPWLNVALLLVMLGEVFLANRTMV